MLGGSIGGNQVGYRSASHPNITGVKSFYKVVRTLEYSDIWGGWGKNLPCARALTTHPMLAHIFKIGG